MCKSSQCVHRCRSNLFLWIFRVISRNSYFTLKVCIIPQDHSESLHAESLPDQKHLSDTTPHFTSQNLCSAMKTQRQNLNEEKSPLWLSTHNTSSLFSFTGSQEVLLEYLYFQPRTVTHRWWNHQTKLDLNCWSPGMTTLNTTGKEKGIWIHLDNHKSRRSEEWSLFE